MTGSAPVSFLQDYPREVTAYSKGMGRISLELAGYQPCHNTEEIIAQIGYDPLHDVANTPDSVFCAHGAGFVVSWDEVADYMHVESCLAPAKKEPVFGKPVGKKTGDREEAWLGTEEIDAILEKTFRANTKEKARVKNGVLKRKRAAEGNSRKNTGD